MSSFGALIAKLQYVKHFAVCLGPPVFSDEVLIFSLHPYSKTTIRVLPIDITES